MKKVAWASKALSVSRMNGVACGMGPSSNVRYTARSSLSMRQAAFGNIHRNQKEGCSRIMG